MQKKELCPVHFKWAQNQQFIPLSWTNGASLSFFMWSELSPGNDFRLAKRWLWKMQVSDSSEKMGKQLAGTKQKSQVQVTALLIDTWDKQFPLELTVFRGLWSALRDTFTFYLYSSPPLLPVTCDLHFVAVGRGKWGKFWLNWRSCMFYLKTHSDHASRECFYF